MFTQKAFEAALQGDETQLTREAGPGIIHVSGDLASVVVAPAAAGHIVLRAEDGSISTIDLPPEYEVGEITVEDGRFVLMGTNGRAIRGTTEQFTAHPEVLAVLLEPPVADAALTNEAQIIEVGEAIVTVGGEQVWLRFEDEGEITALLPLARELLAEIGPLGRAGAEYLLARSNEPGEDDSEDEDSEEEDTDGEEFDEDEFLRDMVATSLTVHPSGEFDLHYETASGTYYLDGYWPSVQFDPDRTPVDFTIEA